MTKLSEPIFFAVVGDIHGRFRKVERWLSELEASRGRVLRFVLAVGDVEAFSAADDPGRKAAKRAFPVEFGEYADGARSFPRPLHFIGGNNENFQALDRLREGGSLGENLRYLGRAGEVVLERLQVAFVSGIYAPRFFEQPLQAPTNASLTKQAGYFRRVDLERMRSIQQPDLMLLHEWPKGLVRRGPGDPVLRAHRMPWIGNPVMASQVELLRPRWLFCGHSHVPFATTVTHSDGGSTRVVCLDQASRAEGAIFWMEWEADLPICAGWGTEGTVAWRGGESWDQSRMPVFDEANSGPAAAGEN